MALEVYQQQLSMVAPRGAPERAYRSLREQGQQQQARTPYKLFLKKNLRHTRVTQWYLRDSWVN